jgi:hypothetical protein
MVSLLAFMKMDVPPLARAAVLGGVCIPAVVALVCGLAVSQFQHWKRDIGIVLVSGVGMTVVVVMMMVCIYFSPELVKLFPGQKLPFLGDLVTGPIFLLLFLALGIFLIMRSRGRAPNNTLQATAARGD